MKINKKNLLCAMIDSGMNNKQLSDASGVSIARISNIRNGNNTTYETVSKIAKALCVSIADLIDETDDEKGDTQQITPMSTFDIAKQFGIKLEPCNDAISREDAIKALQKVACYSAAIRARMIGAIEDLPSVTQKLGKCKNCKYFEYDSVAKVDGIPLIVAHEICNKWGDGCKTSEDGFCFMFEKSEDKE